MTPMTDWTPRPDHHDPAEATDPDAAADAKPRWSPPAWSSPDDQAPAPPAAPERPPTATPPSRPGPVPPAPAPWAATPGGPATKDRPDAPWTPPGTALPDPSADTDTPLLLVTVVAPTGGRTSARVPANVPIAHLAPGLGAAVSVANVTDIANDAGTRIPTSSTLTEAGVADGSTLHVITPGVTGPSTPNTAVRPPVGTPGAGNRPPPPTPQQLADAEPYPMRTVDAPPPTTPAPSRDPFVTPPTGPRPIPTPAIVAVAVATAAVLFVLGGIILGSGGSTPTGPGPVADRAASAWIAAHRFTGPLAPGVPADLGRKGAIAGMPQAGAVWHHGPDAGEAFIVAVPDTVPFGLTVVTHNGKLASAPTISLVPFVIGQRPPAPGAKVTKGGPLPAPVTAWINGAFGPSGPLPPALRFGLSGSPRLLTTWSPAAGGTVLRIQLPLDSGAPGTPTGRLASAANDLNAKVDADNHAVSADQTALTQATGAAQAAQAAAAAGLAANPPVPPNVIAVNNANNAVGGATTKLNQDRALLAADQAASTKAVAAAKVDTASAVATYDVWLRAQAVVGFAPAAYGANG